MSLALMAPGHTATLPGTKRSRCGTSCRKGASLKMSLALMVATAPCAAAFTTLTRPAVFTGVRASASRLCEPVQVGSEEDATVGTDSSMVRSYDNAEETALRAVRLAFGGYPAGKYFTLQQEDSSAAAFEMVRNDFPVLSGWSDQEIKQTVDSLQTTPAELLKESPIGPFLVLSAWSILRDGLGASGPNQILPPCKEYLDFCASVPIPGVTVPINFGS